MNRTMKVVSAVALVVVSFTACKKDATEVASQLTIKTDSLKVSANPAGSFAFFSFKNGTAVPNTDSATNKWDFALRFTTFLVNSASSGPGNAGVILQNSVYSTVTSAPTTGYANDTARTQLAIKDGSWYNYNPTTRTFAPKAGQTFIFRAADGNYVKMELLATDYEPFVGPRPTVLIYRFRYTYQANGTTNF